VKNQEMGSGKWEIGRAGSGKCVIALQHVQHPRTWTSSPFPVPYFLFPFLLFILLPLPLPAYPNTLAGLCGPDRAARLRAGEVLTQVQLKKPAFALLPAHGGVRSLAESLREDLDPGILGETLSVYQKPPGAGAWTEEEKIALYNSVLAISSLAGTEYFSASRSRMRTFYETSTVIDSPESRKPLPDPVYTDPPWNITLYAQQRDLTFGNNIYRYDYYDLGDALVFTQENLTTLSYGIIPAVGKNKLRSLVGVIDAGNYLLIYAASLAKATALPGLGDRIGSSFTNRAQAILNWYIKKADKIFGNEG